MNDMLNEMMSPNMVVLAVLHYVLTTPEVYHYVGDMIDSLMGDLLPVKMIENEEPTMWLRGVHAVVLVVLYQVYLNNTE